MEDSLLCSAWEPAAAAIAAVVDVAWDVGISILVQYEGFPVCNERLMVGRVDDSLPSWVILTPDDDCYIEEVLCPPFSDIEQLVARRGMPAGVRPANADLLAPPPTEPMLWAAALLAVPLLARERQRLIREGALVPYRWRPQRAQRVHSRVQAAWRSRRWWLIHRAQTDGDEATR